MPSVDHFMDEVMTGFRRRLTLLADGGDRRAIEDGIALLGRCLEDGMDEVRLEMLLSALRDGRSPAGLAVLKPAAVGRELSRCWQEYQAEAALAARN